MSVSKQQHAERKESFCTTVSVTAAAEVGIHKQSCLLLKHREAAFGEPTVIFQLDSNVLNRPVRSGTAFKLQIRNIYDFGSSYLLQSTTYQRTCDDISLSHKCFIFVVFLSIFTLT